MADDMEADEKGGSRGRFEESRDKHHGRKKSGRKKHGRKMKGRK